MPESYRVPFFMNLRVNGSCARGVEGLIVIGDDYEQFWSTW
jgi:hypothetical protein